MTWILDLDGVVWLADRPIPGSVDAVSQLRARERVVLVTNNSSLTVAEYLAKLARLGVPTEADDLITSAQVAATLVQPGERVMICAGPGVREAITARGAIEAGDGPADVVMVGWTKDFDYEVLTRAMRAVRAGARLIGTNGDPTYPAPDGVLPGGGSLVAARRLRLRCGGDARRQAPPAHDRRRDRALRPDRGHGRRSAGKTDGLLAKGLGARFALVLTGVTRPSDLPVDPAPDVVAPDLATLVEDWAHPG